MKVVVATISGLVVYIAIAELLGQLLHLHGWDLVVLVGGLMLVGLLIAGTILWFQHRKKSSDQEEPEDGSAAPASTADLEELCREASRRLSNSSLEKRTGLGDQTLFFLVGDAGSTKTTTLIHSGMDPELLAGQAYELSTILPTRLANIWYSQKAIFVDPAGKLLAIPDRWKDLINLVQHGSKMSALRRGEQAPRAAIVFFDIDTFLKPGAGDALSVASRKLADRLRDISRGLGIKLPTYVVFAKSDRIPWFNEYVAGLTQDEVSDVLGATLPLRAPSTRIYAEEETARLTGFFDELIYSLSSRRLELLARENDMEKRAAIYEFPRELSKLRVPLVTFLVELVRPSQLSVNPFLRGFYFSGVRPIIVEEIGANLAPVQPAQSSFDIGATRMFSPGAMDPVGHVTASQRTSSKRIPQWVFLKQLFRDILMQDRFALGLSRASSRVSFVQRILFSILTVAGLVCCAAFAISFMGNRKLASVVAVSVSGLANTQTSVQHLPKLEELEQLEQLRNQLVTIENYKRTGIPLRLRWGLYLGDRIYPAARAAYYRAFSNLLFADTQGRLLNRLKEVPEKPGAGASYDATYNELKAYLITTSYHQKSSRDFLAPVMLDHWTEGRSIDEPRKVLAGAQFDYYASRLAEANPYPSLNDTAAIEKAQGYLAKFAGVDRYYQPLLARAAAVNASISFNETFKDSVGVVVSRSKVRGPFTRDGFSFMEKAMRNPSSMAVEDWVLGKATASELDQATIQSKLRERYYQDFTTEWLQVLKTSSVSGYRDYGDAAQKLHELSGLTSPLLELFWFISHHTSTSESGVTSPFLPVQAIEPPGPADKLPDAYIQPSNKDYILALAKLQTEVASLSANPADPGSAQKVNESASAAMGVVAQVVGTRVDQKFGNEKLVRALLEQPITGVVDLLKNVPTDKLNAAARGMCSQFGQVADRYPFDPNSRQELTLEQLNGLLAPKTGSLWVFYDANLAQVLVKNGSTYSVNQQSPVKPSAALVEFFNRASALSNALYPGGSPNPKFAYTIKVLPSNIDGVTLRIGNESLSGLGNAKTFTWTGVPENIQVTSSGGNPLNSVNGMWSVFRFVSEARAHATGSAMVLEWILQTNNRPILLPNGEVESYHYELHVDGANPFLPNALAHLRCSTPVAH